MYVSIDMLREWLIPIGGLHAYRWFIDDDAWYEALGKGWVYLIRTPQHASSNIIKYGRTINLEKRFTIYINNCPKELQHLGIDIIAFAYVENQSEAEDAISKEFDKQNYMSSDDGREYRVIDVNEEEVTIRDTAFDTFYQALCSIGVDSEAIQYFDEGTNVFKYKRDIA